ncbi:spore gernimation protein GerQ [Gordoniibacillus kamchatkensis]|uniref:Spore gernimation protein GerQ n=1 Tax=Gordoniibacillus kamchatkensis TaxID=1590651 RepID=A0ABR5AFU9_9BACL|nr:spore coat protein [Paenibacillus sp. VKM B-2647]KIL39887.1 spore gernimation protein GerQ [Paenibacillus sp. VKM B-2647]
MNTILEHLTGMNKLTDQIIAADFLVSAKTSIINYSAALTECASAEIKTVLRKQLAEAIDTHGQITDYMMQKGLYRPYFLDEQIRLDLANAQTALSLPS